MKIFVRRQNPFWSNEPANLKDEREEGGKIDAAECPQEQPSWTEAVFGAMLRVKQHADGSNPVHDVAVIISMNQMRPRGRIPAKKRLSLLLTLRRPALHAWRQGLTWKKSNQQNLGMALRDPDRDRQHIPPAVNFALWTAFCLLLLQNGCSRNSNKIHVELRDTPEAHRPAQTLQTIEPPSCPPGNHPPDNDVSSALAGGHTVNLSWNASTSSKGPHGKDIRYCLYRTKGGRVQALVQTGKPGTQVKPSCKNCQRVTINPIKDTTWKDTFVENGAHYCYVAIAIDTVNGEISVFSNQTDAVIPPNKEPPSCTPPADTKHITGKTHHGRP